MCAEQHFYLLPKNRNFKPNAQQLNHLFDHMAEYPEIFTLKCRHQKELNFLPLPLTAEQLAAEYEEKFGNADIEDFMAYETYYSKEFKPDWSSTTPYQGLGPFRKNLFQQLKQNPQLAFVSEREEDFLASTA